MRVLRLSIVLFLVVIAGSNAGTITLTTTNSVVIGKRNQGNWSATTTHDPANYIYLIGPAGQIGGPYTTYRSHLTFNLATVTDLVVSAQLQLTRFGSVGRETTDINGIPINDTNSGVTQTIGVFDVTTDPTVLNTVSGNNPTIYNDLGSGTSYGSFDTTQHWSPDEVLTFNLNAAAVAAINAAHAAFSVGLSLLNAPGTYNDYIFGNTGGSYIGVQALTLTTVPEASSLVCLLFGIVILSARRIRRLTK